jgi:hypothetical protein
MKNLFFGLIATVMISVSGFAKNDLNESIVDKKEIINYNIDGKVFAPEEFAKLNSKTVELAQECTVTIRVTVQTQYGPLTFTTTETFEASWLGCMAAKIGAFLASIWTPSI